MTTLVAYSGLSHPLFSLSSFCSSHFFFFISIVVVVIKCRYPWRSLSFFFPSLFCVSVLLVSVSFHAHYILRIFTARLCVCSLFTSLSFPSSRVQSSPHSLCVPFYFAHHVKILDGLFRSLSITFFFISSWLCSHQLFHKHISVDSGLTTACLCRASNNKQFRTFLSLVCHKTNKS